MVVSESRPDDRMNVRCVLADMMVFRLESIV